MAQVRIGVAAQARAAASERPTAPDPGASRAAREVNGTHCLALQHLSRILCARHLVAVTLGLERSRIATAHCPSGVRASRKVATLQI